MHAGTDVETARGVKGKGVNGASHTFKSLGQNRSLRQTWRVK
jgi:hypothetical protein